jgi:hypothetical protein
MIARLVCAATAAATAAAIDAPDALHDDSTSATFDVDTGSPCFGQLSGLAIVEAGIAGPSLLSADCDIPLWELQLVTKGGTKAISLQSKTGLPASTRRAVTSPSANQLAFVWNITNPYAVDVTVSVSLTDGLLSFVPTFDVKVCAPALVRASLEEAGIHVYVPVVLVNRKPSPAPWCSHCAATAPPWRML